MRPKRYWISAIAVVAFAAIVIAGKLLSSPRVQAQGVSPMSPVEIGFKTAPVPLNLGGKNRYYVGLGSYLVNDVASCDDCHSDGPPSQFVKGGNPYFGQTKTINPLTYLGGGRDFGALPSGGPHIISRNLTPDYTGLPEGGRTFSEFYEIMTTGTDLDHLHPTCTATITTNCIPPPFDGDLLQIMPWPSYMNLTKADLRAIYEYLSAIPCIAGPPAPSPLHNVCEE